MKVTTAFLAHRAHLDTYGHLHVEGGLWSELRAPGVPAQHKFVLVALTTFDESDLGVPQTGIVTIRNASGFDMHEATVDLTVQKGAPVVPLLMPLDVMFGTTGRHELTLRLGDEVVAQLALNLALVS